MKKIRLWSVNTLPEAPIRVTEVASLTNTETEQRLEELLVTSPDLLFDGGVFIGWQVPTEGGPLDLIGVDQDGQLVVFELKRGTLTREAVSQVLDYASDIAGMSADRLARLIEESSGRSGIEKITDFADWYSREYPDAELLSAPPRMVLVGLGVDDRARRIVDFLADAGIDIQLLTFHAFAIDGHLMLARQVESAAPAPGRGQTAAPTKEENRKVLCETAQKQGAEDLLEEVASFIEDRIPGYMWPGKTAYSYSLQEKTSAGKPSLRNYVTLYVNHRRRGSLLLTFAQRAVDAAVEEMDAFVAAVPDARRSSSISSGIPVELELTPGNWSSISLQLDRLLRSIVEGWQARSKEANASEPDVET